jgi:hypothetical protein
MAIPGAGADPDPDAWKWRRLTAEKRDLMPLTQERQLELAYWLYRTNPQAYRIVELTKDFVVGEGIKYKAVSPEIQAVLDKHWNDPVNAWDLKQHKRALELGLYGEQVYPVFVREHDGRVRLGSIDPAFISEVKLDEENAEIVKTIRLKEMPKYPLGKRELEVIHVDEDPKSKTYGRLVGDCFFFAVNRVTHATRGTSDLAPLIDWIDGFDQFLFNRLDRSLFATNFIWDVTLEGASQSEIDEFLKRWPKMKPGMVRAHNEKVSYKIVAPNLEARDASEEAKLIKHQIVAGAGLPSHWLGEAGDANRATAAEMGIPATKRLKARQRYFRYMIEHIFNFVIDQAIIARPELAKVDRSYEVIMPQIWALDVQRVTASMSQGASALLVAEQQEWITSEQAAEIFALLVSQLGWEMKPGRPSGEKPREQKEVEEHYEFLRSRLEGDNGDGRAKGRDLFAEDEALDARA